MNCLSLRLSELWNWWLVLAYWWLVLADHFCQNWSWAIEKLWFWCLLSCLELPNDPQYVCTSCLGFLKAPNTSNGPYMISCFFRSAKSHFWAWWTDISHPMRQKNSPKNVFLQNLVNMILELGPDQIWRSSAQNRTNARCLTENSDVTYFYLGSSSYMERNL